MIHNGPDPLLLSTFTTQKHQHIPQLQLYDNYEQLIQLIMLGMIAI